MGGFIVICYIFFSKSSDSLSIAHREKSDLALFHICSKITNEPINRVIKNEAKIKRKKI